MKYLLVGNGMNIHIEEEYMNKNVSDYKNNQILKRVIENLSTQKYYDIFEERENKISKEELKSAINLFKTKFIEFIDEVFDDRKLILSLNDETDKEKERDFQRIYKKLRSRKEYCKIGMEDYFFVLKLFCNKYLSTDLYFELHTFIQWIFLDSIYNHGEINKLYSYIESMHKDRYAKWLNSYNRIFTVNYDVNVEEICNTEIQYLHGNFKTLRDEYNINTFLGKSLKDIGSFYKVKEHDKHLFCSAIMGHSGFSKEKQIIKTKIIDRELGNIYGKINQIGCRRKTLIGKINKKKYLQDLSKNNRIQYLYYVNRFEGKMNQYFQYNLEELESIKGEVDIVGMSPFNDDHIWKRIIKNKRLKINYYYVEAFKVSEIEALNYLFTKNKETKKHRIEYKTVKEIWSEIL